MSNLLDYSPAPQSPVRLGRLALGVAAVFLAVLFQVVVYLVPRIDPSGVRYTSLTIMILANYLPSILASVMVVAAVVLLGSALCPKPGAFRLGYFTALVLALVFVICRVIIVGLGVSTMHSVARMGDIRIWLLYGFLCLTVLAEGALLLGAGWFFVIAAGRVGRKILGVLSLLALLPSALYFFLYFPYCVWMTLSVNLGWGGPGNPLIRLVSTLSVVNLGWLFVVWLALTLGTAILALRRR